MMATTAEWPEVDLRFTLCGHLGKSSREKDQDQRLAFDQLGNWYLYDWSGGAPDRTDDGPLCVDFDEPIQVSLTGCIARVVKVRDNGRYNVHVSLHGMMRMIDKLREAGQQRMPKLVFDDDAQLFALAALMDYHRKQEWL